MPLKPEELECKALVQWSQTCGISRVRDCLIHVPNERPSKVQRMILAAMGVRTGVSDFFLATAVGRYHGLWIEMKTPQRPRLTPMQRTWLLRMASEHYAACKAVGWVAASHAILYYMQGRWALNDQPSGILEYTERESRSI